MAYIVNTDPHGQPGRHWLALWTQDGACEILDSYALPLETYQTTGPLLTWLQKHWDVVIPNSQSLQSVYSQSCGDYALFFLIDRSQGKSMKEFLNRFDKHDYVHNDHQVGQMLKTLIQKQLGWTLLCTCETRHVRVSGFNGIGAVSSFLPVQSVHLLLYQLSYDATHWEQVNLLSSFLPVQ